MSVVIIPGIAKMMTELEFWRKAWDALAANDAFALESRGWVGPPRFAVEFLPPISCRIEHNGVNVHLSALLVAQDDPRGKAWHDLSGVREAQFRERGLRLARLHASNHEIQIVVGPGFLLEKCVDAPAAVDPVADAVILESANDLKDIHASHEFSSAGKAAQKVLPNGSAVQLRATAPP